MRPLRPGGSWSEKGGLCTLAEVGTDEPDADGRRLDDRLVGLLATPDLAWRVATAVNQHPDLEALARWLVALDDPDDQARQTVTLNQIIARARTALGLDQEGNT